MEKLGLLAQVYTFPSDIFHETDFEHAFLEINEEETIDGILLFRPFPARLMKTGL